MKKIAKNIIAKILGWQVRRLRNKQHFKVVVVVGSIGKTSTKHAIAKVLQQKYRVRFQEGNYNDLISVPLVFFGLQMPSLMNPFAWLKTILKIENQLKKTYPYDVVVLELGTDGPGQIKAFGSYINADIGVITAISQEHMEFFDNIDEVAKEELSLAEFTNHMVINSDLCNRKYFNNLSVKQTSFGKNKDNDFVVQSVSFDSNTANFEIKSKGKKHEFNINAISMAEIYTAISSIVVANIFTMNDDEIESGLKQIKPVSGRMQRLSGINNSTIIDETYNASPLATKLALDSLYEFNASQKIAVLGNMNELGAYSKQAHTEVGEYCDPQKVDLIITIGKDANQYLAKAAEKRGCRVEIFENPYSVGEYLKDYIKKDAAILLKGSQNGVFAEEAIKLILEDQDDVKKLVRQSDYWMNIKNKAFGNE